MSEEPDPLKPFQRGDLVVYRSGGKILGSCGRAEVKGRGTQKGMIRVIWLNGCGPHNKEEEDLHKNQLVLVKEADTQ